MYIIAGLGNPTKEYENTRHNVGFEVIGKLAEETGIRVTEKKFRALTGKGNIAGKSVVLAKPQTYMNLSGESIKELVNFYKADPSCELIVISDDVSLDPGQIRIRRQGSAGGHNGLKNIILNLGQDAFVRVRVGVGSRPEQMDLVHFVLGHFAADERKVMDGAVKEAAEAVRVILEQGADAAMNRFNRKNVQEQGRA